MKQVQWQERYLTTASGVKRPKPRGGIAEESATCNTYSHPKACCIRPLLKSNCYTKSIVYAHPSHAKPCKVIVEYATQPWFWQCTLWLPSSRRLSFHLLGSELPSVTHLTLEGSSMDDWLQCRLLLSGTKLDEVAIAWCHARVNFLL